MADLNITVDSKQVVEAKRDISDLERSFSSAYKSAQTFMTAFARTSRMDAYANSLGKVAKANQELINNNLGVTRSYKSAEESAKSFTRVLENQERAAREATAALNQRLGVTGPSATESGAGFAALEGQIERLKIKYDSVYAASQLYERSLNELNQAQTLGAINAKQHESALEQLNNEYQQFQNGSANAMNRFSQANQVANKGMRNFGLVVQQSGYQVGDFLVQVQGGTNWMVAFGQQATQLAGLMTTFGGKFVVIGAALSILIPLATAVGAAFMRTGKDSEEAAKGVDKQKQAYDALTESIRQLRLEEQMAGTGLSSQEQQVLNDLNLLQAQRNVLLLEQEDLYRKANEQIDSFNTSEQDRIATELAANAKSIQDRERILRLFAEEQAKKETAANINAQMQAVELAHYRAMGDRERERVAAGEAYYQKMLAVQGAQEKQVIFSKLLREELQKAGVNATNLSDTDITTGIWGGAAAALALAERLGIALTNARGLSGIAAYEASGSADAAARRNSLTMGKEGGTLTSGAGGVRTAPTGGGGGGGGNSALESLIGQLQTEREVLSDWYADSQEMLRNASAEELEILGGKYEAMARLDADYRQKVYEAQQQQSQMSFQAYSGMFSALNELLSLFAGKSKGAAIAALAIQKGLAIAQIVTSTAAAQMRAYAELGPIAGAVMAAKIGLLGKLQAGLVAATGLVQAGQISSGSSASSGSGGSPGTSRVAPAGESAAPQTVYIDSIDPEGLYSGQTLMNLFDAFYNENDKRGKVFLVGRA